MPVAPGIHNFGSRWYRVLKIMSTRWHQRLILEMLTQSDLGLKMGYDCDTELRMHLHELVVFSPPPPPFEINAPCIPFGPLLYMGKLPKLPATGPF